MVFSSIPFLFYFLPLFFVAYYVLPWKNHTFFAASVLFYAWGEGTYVLILLNSVVLNFLAGRLLDRLRRGRQGVLLLSVVANLLLLGSAKYLAFTEEQLSILFDFRVGVAVFDELPLGISFFTFQAISYLIDVYRRTTPAETSFINVGLYISMFPQLIAGPIVRFNTIVQEIHHRTHTWSKVTDGVKLFVTGLALKVLIADTVSKPADGIFSISSDALTIGLAWIGSVLYTIQIYFDFCGYSLMAIGLGKFFGFSLPINFNYPYMSRSISEFWRRWHITLSLWFRDYLYIPLGGNRCGAKRTYQNLIVVFVLCGLWHGAAFTFLLWGLWHGAFLVLERVVLSRVLKAVPSFFRHSYVLLVVIFGWVLFRSDSLESAFDYMTAMIGFGANSSTYELAEFLQFDVMAAICFGVLLSWPWWNSVMAWLGSPVDRKFSTRRVGIEILASTGMTIGLFLLLMMVSLKLIASSYSPFLYFRF